MGRSEKRSHLTMRQRGREMTRRAETRKGKSKVKRQKSKGKSAAGASCVNNPEVPTPVERSSWMRVPCESKHF
jgi:hypothetical protein